MFDGLWESAARAGPVSVWGKPHSLEVVAAIRVAGDQPGQRSENGGVMGEIEGGEMSVCVVGRHDAKARHVVRGRRDVIEYPFCVKLGSCDSKIGGGVECDARDPRGSLEEYPVREEVGVDCGDEGRDTCGGNDGDTPVFGGEPNFSAGIKSVLERRRRATAGSWRIEEGPGEWDLCDKQE